MEPSQRSLKRVFSQYIEVAPGKLVFNIERNLSQIPFPQSTRNKSLPRSISTYRVEHDSPVLYQSVIESKQILDKNKQVYQKVSNQLRQIEVKNYERVFRETQSDLRKLRSFKSRFQRFSQRSIMPKPPSYPSVSTLSDPKLDQRFLSSTVCCKLPRFSHNRLPVKWTQYVPTGYYTESREGATFTTFTVKTAAGVYEERTYLFGGLSRDLYQQLTYLKVNKVSTKTCTYEWVLSNKGEEKLKRFGHSACLWPNSKLLVVGGARKYMKEAKRRECLNDCYFYSPYEQEWRELTWKSSFTPRRSHITFVVGKHLVVHGGIDSLDNYLDDAMVTSLENVGAKGKWTELDAIGDCPGPLAYHTVALVFTKDRYKNMGGLYTSSIYCSNEETEILHQGVYVFGGKDQSGVKNDVYILKVGEKPCEWIKPVVGGKPPLPRYGHSMTFVSEKNLLVVFGGRNDQAYKYGKPSYLNDIWLLMLDRLEWMECKIEGYVPEARYSHSAGFLEGKLMIFGGLGVENYCKGTLEVLEWKKGGVDFIPKEDTGEKLTLPLITQQEIDLTGGAKANKKLKPSRKQANGLY